MLKLIEYQIGGSKEWEVMKESTAELVAATNFSSRSAFIEREYANMLALVKGNRSVKNPEPKLPSYEAWYIAKYNRLPA